MPDHAMGIRPVLGAIILAAWLAGPVATTAAEAPAPSGFTRSPRLGAWGFDLAGMDRSARPGDDFNRYANGGYLDRLQIPADQSSYGATSAYGEAVQNELRAIVEQAAARRGAQGRDAARIGALYRSYMDEARVQRLDDRPLRKSLAAIRAIRTRSQMARSMGAAQGGFGASIVSLDVNADARDPGRHQLYLNQSGLGLPDRSRYLDPQFDSVRIAYRAYIRTLLADIGWPAPDAAAADILAFETRIAEAHWSRQERRDPQAGYAATRRQDLAAAAPEFPWRDFFQGAGMSPSGPIVQRESTATPKLARIFAATPLPTLKAWQAFHVADDAAPYLSDRFVQARFRFRQQVLDGQPQIEPRWKRGVALVNATLGEPLGREFVRQWLPPATKAKAEAIVANVVAAMKARIAANDWMSGQTKAEALDKLAKLRWQVGYPDRWRDDSGLRMRADDLVGDIQRAAAFEWAFQRRRIGAPVDRDEWFFMPQAGQAYYAPTENQVVIAAAVLQPPNFDPDADPAINYGAIGAIVGHEISHGFDDQGRRYDGDGRLRDWWRPEDEQRFKTRSDVLARQFDALEVLPGLRMNGRLALGEDMADLGGILLALDAYRLSLKGGPSPIIDGFTGEQRVFLGWAQKWRRKYREPTLRALVASDPHAPGDIRAAAPLRDVDAWYAAFDVRPGDKAYLAPEQRARIW